jgi:AcrR family transcriptional regulator
MSEALVETLPSGSALGRRPKATADDIIRTAWELFEAEGFDSTTMADIATAVGISRRTLFNYFATKEALLFPVADEYMAEFTRLLLDRPEGEPLFASLNYCLQNCRDKQVELEEKFSPGPAVHAARLSDSAVRYSRDHWALEMERAVRAKLAGQPDAATLAGFVGALAAQVWTEMAKHMRAAGTDADIDTALSSTMTSLRQLFA